MPATPEPPETPADHPNQDNEQNSPTPTASLTPGKLPGTYKVFIQKFPELGAAHEQVAKAVESYGPMDAKQCALVKIGICVGAGLESALRSHVRRAMQHGATVEEIEQAVLLAMNTCGFPRTVAAWSWAHQQIDRGV